MTAALKYRRTEKGCKQSLQAALNALPPGDEQKEKYIIKEWVETGKQVMFKAAWPTEKR
jgi:hypothetical protein